MTSDTQGNVGGGYQLIPSQLVTSQVMHSVNGDDDRMTHDVDVDLRLWLTIRNSCNTSITIVY